MVNKYKEIFEKELETRKIKIGSNIHKTRPALEAVANAILTDNYHAMSLASVTHIINDQVGIWYTKAYIGKCLWYASKSPFTELSWEQKLKGIIPRLLTPEEDPNAKDHNIIYRMTLREAVNQTFGFSYNSGPELWSATKRIHGKREILYNRFFYKGDAENIKLFYYDSANEKARKELLNPERYLRNYILLGVDLKNERSVKKIKADHCPDGYLVETMDWTRYILKIRQSRQSKI